MRDFLKGAFPKYLLRHCEIHGRVTAFHISADLLAKKKQFNVRNHRKKKGKYIEFQSPKYDGYLLLI